MSQTSKALRRLCLATGAVTVAGVLPVLAAIPAFAASGATLTVSPTTLGSQSQSSLAFTSSGAASSTIGIQSLVSSGAAPTAANAITLPQGTTPYTVYVNGVADAVTTNSNNSTIATPFSETLTLTTALPASAASVTVSIFGTTNPTSASTDYFTATDTSPTNTNSVTFTGPTAAAPTVTSVNPNAVGSTGAYPVTISGSGFTTFGTGPTEPDVCFLPTTATVPSSPSGCTTAGGALATSVNEVSSGQIEAFTPVLNTTRTSYDVVVYNPTSTTAFTAGSATSAADQVVDSPTLDVVPQSGVRVADSRTGQGFPKGAIPSGSTIAIPLTDLEVNGSGLTALGTASNVPSTATAIAMNVTAIAPGSVGNLQLYTGTATGTPTTSTVNFQPGVDTGNYAIVPISSGATYLFVKDNGASVNVALDVTGYTNSGATTNTGSNAMAAGTRILDTRSGTKHVGNVYGPLNGGQVYSFATGLPANTMVALNVTAVAPSAVGNLRVYPEPATGPSVSTVPNTAVVNYIPGTDAGSYLVTEVGNNGNIDLYSDTAGSVNVVIDYSTTIVSAHVTTLQPYRVKDTRPNGIASGGTVTVTPGNTGTPDNGTPSNALASIASVSDINPTAVGNLQTYPMGNPLPNTATVSNYPNQVRQDLGIIALRGGQFELSSEGSYTNSTVDLYGYIS